MLIDQAVQAVRERRVTLGYVWTRADNEAPSGCTAPQASSTTRQLVLTWYPTDPSFIGSIPPET